MRKPIYLSILSLGVALQLPAFAVVRERETPAPSPRESIVFVSCAAAVNRAVKTANVPVERYFFEVLESQTLNWSPLYSVDITSVIDRKLEMLRAYECQNANDSLAMEKREQAAKRGAERRPRTAYAETFTSLDGRPVAGGVLERLKETARLRTL